MSSRTFIDSAVGTGVASASTDELIATVDDLLLLAEVVEAGGIRAASIRTGLTKSRLSRRIAALEERLAVCLLTRNSHLFEVTEIGHRLYEQALQIRAATRAAITLADETSSEPSGLLRIACPFALSHTVVAGLAIEFARQHPRVRLYLTTTKGTAEALSEHHDVIIHPSSQPLPDSDIVARRLVTVPYALVAAPAFVTRAGSLAEHPSALDGLTAIAWNTGDAVTTMHLSGPAGAEADVRMRTSFAADNLVVVRDAALAGLGVARLPLAICADDIAQGRLCVLAPGWAPPPMVIYVLYPSRRQLSLAGQSFVQMLQQHLQARWGSDGAPAPA
jgi:DNA-binding transcriptional LysR family regulator